MVLKHMIMYRKMKTRIDNEFPLYNQIYLKNIILIEHMQGFMPQKTI